MEREDREPRKKRDLILHREELNWIDRTQENYREAVAAIIIYCYDANESWDNEDIWDLRLGIQRKLRRTRSEK